MGNVPIIDHICNVFFTRALSLHDFSKPTLNIQKKKNFNGESVSNPVAADSFRLADKKNEFSEKKWIWGGWVSLRTKNPKNEWQKVDQASSWKNTIHSRIPKM
jgi:hypothetical protein